ncbi:hypothetical protein [Alicyclobacillus fastidiosus]|uniref:Uncharacterized protein n=1 Tax=Alicyclobacillus fastidiosus TaxID=392011 RepID=A0ABV5AB79_9BACL|nr:hypothetical protein [Alicyclobacillus fastidiosus]WEH10503.1 hypothetical protein PYS47_04560 [Alicyclobacillus fastidiosus]
MFSLKKSLVIGTLATTSFLALPALASADTLGAQQCNSPFNISTEVEGNDLIITVTYPGGQIVIDPPVVLS